MSGYIRVLVSSYWVGEEYYESMVSGYFIQPVSHRNKMMAIILTDSGHFVYGELDKVQEQTPNIELRDRYLGEGV